MTTEEELRNQISDLLLKNERLKEELEIVKHDSHEHIKVVQGLIKFGREGRLEEYISAVIDHLQKHEAK